MIVALTFMTVLTVVQVVLRYGFGTGFVWSLEATTYTFAWLVLIGMSYGVRTEAHIAVDLVTSRLTPERRARRSPPSRSSCGLAYCALMIYGSAQFVDRLMALGNDARDIPLPRWLLTGIMPIAFVLLALAARAGRAPGALAASARRATRNDGRRSSSSRCSCCCSCACRSRSRSGLSSILTMLLFAEQSLVALAQRFFSALQVYPLLAIPFFILAGALMTTGGVAKRMIAFANSLVGHFRGGLAMAALLACALFAAVSGSSPATVVAVGSIMIAGMARSGYTREFAAGLDLQRRHARHPDSAVDRHGRLRRRDGDVDRRPVHRRRRAGHHADGDADDRRRGARAPARTCRGSRAPTGARVLKTGRDAIWGLLLIVIILGGIYSGVFTPTEAAAVSAVYAFVIAVFVYRDVRLRDVPQASSPTPRRSRRC